MLLGAKTIADSVGSIFTIVDVFFSGNDIPGSRILGLPLPKIDGPQPGGVFPDPSGGPKMGADSATIGGGVWGAVDLGDASEFSLIKNVRNLEHVEVTSLFIAQT